MASAAEVRDQLFDRKSGVLSDRVEYRLAETDDEKDLVYRLRYKAYLHGGVTDPSETERVNDHYDEAPNAWIAGVFVDGELCSSLRLNVLTSACRISGASALFDDVLNPRLDDGEVFVDPLRLAADPEKSRLFPDLPYLTVRLAFMACGHFEADTGLAMVRTEHHAFYRRIFLAKPIAEPRSFPGFLPKVGLLASNYPTIEEPVTARFPFMRSTSDERRKLFTRRGRQAAQAGFESGAAAVA